jgi:hypothetical protein
MMIAYTMGPDRGDTDRLLFTLAHDLAARGYRTCGTVQINTECDGQPCDMDVQVLPDGPVLRISQSLGPSAKGCRLDPSTLEKAVGMVASHLTTGADVLIVNKFGKHEADGRGFRPVIADAISRGVPVLVGVNSLNLHAFQDFAGPDIRRLDPLESVLKDWLAAAVIAARDVA